VNKKELVDAIAVRLDDDRKTAAAAVEAVIDEITRALVKGDRVQLTGFGTFEKRERPARVGRNPRTGEAVKIKKTSAPAFKAGAGLKAHVSGATKLPRVTATKAAAKKAAPAKKAVATKAPAKKAAPAKKIAAKKVAATKAAPAKKAPAKKVAAKKVAAKKTTRAAR
jgi:DNA-binding protein HU-beta